MKAFRIQVHSDDVVDLVFAKNKWQAYKLAQENKGICHDLGFLERLNNINRSTLSHATMRISVIRESKFDGMENEDLNELIYKLIKTAGWFYGDYQITCKNIDQKDIRDYLNNTILKRNSIFYYDKNLRK
ncbi:MAG: hypothetical protein HDS11_04040 [Bacteroides sp.]|nr:hypothetical protein [Bacteroides sp.]